MAIWFFRLSLGFIVLACVVSVIIFAVSGDSRSIRKTIVVMSGIIIGVVVLTFLLFLIRRSLT